MSDASDGDFHGDFHGGRFGTAAIVGLGLMGGSLALALRARWPDTTIVGVDRAEVLEKVQASGAIDRGATDVAAAIAGGDIDLIVLAAPVLQNIVCLDTIGPHLGAVGAASASRPIVVTDLGSTKRAIVDAARSLPSHVTFLGGHPMAGAARGGFTAARGDLFRGRPWILTPDASTPTPSAALARLQGFVNELGAEPVIMDPDEHDRVMAYVSHLPQLVASGLMRVIGPHVGADGLAVSGQGLADSTRLASSPAGVWTDICQTNAAPLGKALDALIADLQYVRRQLTEPEAMASWLESGARWRSELPNG